MHRSRGVIPPEVWLNPRRLQSRHFDFPREFHVSHPALGHSLITEYSVHHLDLDSFGNVK